MQEVSRRKALILEVGAVLGWMFIPALARFAGPGPRYTLPSPVDATPNLSIAFDTLAVLVLLGFIVWISGDPLKTFGLRRIRLHPDLLAAILLALLLTASRIMPYWSEWIAYFKSPYRTTIFNAGSTVGISILLMMIANAVQYEFIFRGYLIPRLEELTQNVWVGVVVSALLFASSAWLWSGWLAGTLLFGEGLALGIAFVATRSIVPLVAAQLIMPFIWTGQI